MPATKHLFHEVEYIKGTRFGDGKTFFCTQPQKLGLHYYVTEIHMTQ
jgi:hypothetical protein